MGNPTPRIETRFQGVAVSAGLALAGAHVASGFTIRPTLIRIGSHEVEAELQRFELGVEETKQQIISTQEHVSVVLGSHDAGIFDAHLMFLEDPAFLHETRRMIGEQLLSCESAASQVLNRYSETLLNLDDDYLRERAVDVLDVCQRLLRQLTGHRPRENRPTSAYILIAYDLNPSDTALLDREVVKAFATEAGSATSHTAIMARSLGIPAVVGVHGLHDAVQSDDEVLVDGFHGLVILNPNAATLEEYRLLRERTTAMDVQIEKNLNQSCVTLCGRKIVLSANIEFPHEVQLVNHFRADGVGLYRTEFLYLNRPHATEDELTEIYTSVVKGCAPNAVIFRTLDVGGDKMDTTPGRESHEAESNPFLGWRGIRISLDRPEKFKMQLRAMLRASAHGHLKIMFPMITTCMEFTRARDLLDGCRAELAALDIPMADQVEVGAMIEIPAAALSADLLARKVDFFSIGTNDLVQYTLAVDRTNERVAPLYQPTHPGVLRLIRMTVEAAIRRGILVGVCGETASDVFILPLLLGLGVRELSVAPGQLLRVKHAIRHLQLDDCYRLVNEILDMDDPLKIHEKSRALAMAAYGEMIVM